VSDITESAQKMSPVKQALIALEEMQAKLDRIEQERTEPIAIIGMACRFPGGAQDPESFWRLLRDGVDTVTEVPPERWDADAYYDPDPQAQGKMSTRWGSFLRDVDQFDAAFFGIAPREASSMDPQQRLLLEVAWEAFERAGQTAEQLRGSSTGVFVGIYGSDYFLAQYDEPGEMDMYSGTGTSHSIAAGRLSYVWDLRGPSVAIDTACSSSLVALHLACQSLRSRECDRALAAGVNLLLSPWPTLNASRMRLLAPDGRCKTFDARADGIVRGEGCAVLVLKRLSDARSAHDPILALIRGSAVNQDGHSSGLTAPNALAQQAVIRQALAQARLTPEQITLVEAHGTGTALGDPIEVEALTAVLDPPGNPVRPPCFLGSVKANLGHLEAAAGLASVVKVVLALQQAQIPAQLHFQRLNPAISLDTSRFRIPTSLTPWTVPEGSRRVASVSSFGWSGTNAHVVLEEAPALPVSPSAAPSEPATSAPQPALLPLSARTQPALLALAQRYLPLLDSLPAELFPSLCSSASQRRSHLPARLALLASSPSQAASRLRSFLDHPDLPADHPGLAAGLLPPGGRPRLVWVFPGQGWQFPGMVRPLLSRFPAFQQSFSSCQQALLAAGIPPLDELLAQPERWLQLDVLQPLLFAIQVSLASLWLSWGLLPDALIGHSLGEVAAAHLAGVLSLEQAATIVAERSRLLEQLRGQGAMLSVELSEQEAELLLAQQGWQTDLAVAVSNGPHSSVLAGSRPALDAVERFLQARQVNARWVEVPVASHCGQVEPILPALRSRLAGLRGHQGHLAWYSTVSGLRQEGEGLTGEYWVRNLRQRVRLWAAVQAVLSEGPASFVEISAHPVLVGSLAQGLAEVDKASLALWSLRRERAEEECLLESLAQLYVRGHEPAWDRLLPAPPRWVDLPTYPWQHERFWFEEQPHAELQRWASSFTRRQFAGHPFLGQYIHTPVHSDTHVWYMDLGPGSIPYLGEHRVQELCLLPAAASVELALAAAAAVLGGCPWRLEQVILHKALIFTEEKPQSIQFIMRTALPGSAGFQIYSNAPGDEENSSRWELHTTGSISRASKEAAAEQTICLAERQEHCLRNMPQEAFYERLEATGLQYGKSFRAVEECWLGEDEAIGRVRLPQPLQSEATAYQVHPVLLDACLQLLEVLIPSHQGDSYVPICLKNIAIYSSPTENAWGYARLHILSSDIEKEVRGEVRLLDDNGQLILFVEEVTLQRLEGSHKVARQIDNWLYEWRWHALSNLPNEEERSGMPGGRWLVFADEGGVGQRIQALLEQQGEECTLISLGSACARLSSRQWSFDPRCREELPNLLQDILGASHTPYRGIVHLWSLPYGSEANPVDVELLDYTHTLGCYSVLALVQALTRMGWRDAPRLWLITAGSQDVEGHPNRLIDIAQLPLWGLGRTIVYEHPELRCTCIDLSQTFQEDELPGLWSELQTETHETQVALRGQKRYGARLTRLPLSEHLASSLSLQQLASARETAYGLATSKPGVLENLYLQAEERRTPGPGEIEIAVYAAGLNFLDVLSAMGIRPDWQGEPLWFGLECAGVVVAVGEGVKHIASGDEVVAVVPGAFKTFVTANATLVAPKPRELSFVQAAGLPIAFMTASHALEHLARLQPGERVLIHAAAGGVGQAAIQIARSIGAEIFATAGSPDKRAFLREQGIKHIFDSRNLDFAEQILQITRGKGVDVVLNALSGEAIPASLQVLAPYGRFLEIGKKDIYENHSLGLLPFHKNLCYFAIDLARMLHERTEHCGALLRTVLERVAQGQWSPLPSRTFPFAQAGEAFRYMAQARHTGKIVFEVSDSPVMIRKPQQRPSTPPECTYLITGGLGGVGLQVARWLIEQRGARHLVLVGLHGPNAATQKELELLARTGARVVVKEADVTQYAQIADVLREVVQTMPPLRGVFHAAGLLDDGLLLHQDWSRFKRVLEPKLIGAWNLHTLTVDLPLDYFVLFSSITSLLGSPGQGNYAAANAFLDGLAHYRRAAGLPAISINWGPWAQVGLAAAQANRGGRLAFRGIASLQPQQGLEALAEVLQHDTEQVAVVDFRPRQWCQFYPQIAQTALLDILLSEAQAESREARSNIRAALQECEPVQRRALLEKHLREQIAQVLQLSPERIDQRTVLSSLGFDSLMALELRNRLEISLGLTLSGTLVWGYPTITDLATHLAQQMGISLEAVPLINASTERETPTTPETTELEQLSEAEIAALLEKELAHIDEGRLE
jgi:acyl transferase domain-containing protein/NADPH:quinone reductase-like Zn-dependent oxidoreductase/acyl carrier protein